MNNCEPIDHCIACGSSELVPVLDLGFQPLANSYKRVKWELQPEYPLAVTRCNHCFHVQLTHQVNPELMFKNYAYVSGTSETQKEYFSWLRDFIKTYITPKTVLDIGCNDGSFLYTWEGSGAHTFGVDPAQNLYPISSVHHTVHCGFFTGKEFGDTKFDVITCLNAFAHNSDQLALLKNIGERMHDKSILVCTTSQANMIKNGEFDAIYHEHVSYFNTASAKALVERAGLQLIDIQRHPIHGESLILVIGKKKGTYTDFVIQDLIQDELDAGLYGSKIYEEFADKSYQVAHNFAGFIRNQRVMKIPIVGYGAAAKGNTLMNFANEIPDFIIDDNPLKQGLFTPGMGCPIYGPEYLDNYKDTPRLIVIPLAWNFYDEVVRRWKELRPNNLDVFVRYFPNFETK